MLRKILKALRSALRAMVKAIDGTWRTVFGSGGGDIVVDDYEPAMDKSVESVGTTPAPVDEHVLRTESRRDAALVYVYAGKCQLDGVRPPAAPCLPRVTRDWLAGLSLADLRLLTDAGQDGIRAHLSTGPYIQGLHRIRRLPPIALATIPGPAVDHDGPPRNAAVLRALGF